MYFIDTHIHLQDYKLINATDIIRQTLRNGGQHLICVSADEKDWERVVKLFEQYPDVIVPAFGIHPWYVSQVKSDWPKRLSLLLQKYPQALIGECGLDGYKDFSELQAEVFKQHTELAKEYSRPLIIHAVKSQNNFEKYWQMLPEKFVFHSYNGRTEFLTQIVKHNGYVGLSASILKNKNIKEILNIIPQNRLLLESDGPYQSFHPDTESYPWFIPEEIRQLEQISGCSMAEQIYHNSLEFIKC